MLIADLFRLIGYLSLVIGLLLLFAPRVLKKLNELSGRMIAKTDNLTFSYRIGFGVSLMLASLFMFFMAYYFAKKHY
ncbi:MAG: hypothetical protein WC855_10700 [Thermodesulfovibrionales bacterium]